MIPDSRRWRLSLIALSLSFWAAGCVDLAPSYTRPAPAVPRAAEPAATDPTELAWRSFFTDDRLRRLVGLALANNRDLRSALLNVEQARALARVSQALSLPSVNATASGERANGFNNFSVQPAAVSYELDLFGAVKNQQASAQQTALASAESRRAAQIGLVASIAGAWLSLAGDLQQQLLAQQTLASLQRSHRLNERRHELGAITGLALAQSRTAVDSARVSLASTALQIEQDRHQLELLAGAAVPADLLPSADDSLTTSFSVLVDLPAGVPSSVLQRRPDVLAAEHQLQAAYANIGVARAALFPAINLTAAAGTASRALSGLFKAGSKSWSYGSGISLPIFDGGAGRANVEASQFARDAALAQYDKTIQIAFSEVADALSVRASLGERLAAQQALLDSSALQLRLAEATFAAGGSTQLDVLDAQRSFYSAQQSMISLRLAEQTNRLTLYKVLGGGWKDES